MDNANLPASLEQRYLDLRADLDAVKRSRRRNVRSLTAALALGLLGFGVHARAQVAADSLVSFGSGQPARASDVNHNFNLLKVWLEQKVGSVGSADITVGGDSGGAIQTSGALALNFDSKATVQFFDTATSIQQVGSGVYDDTTSDAPYSRVNADSFHTNGLGVGQMFIEGYAIDANQVIRIGKGHAGGMAAQQTQVSSLDYSGHLTGWTLRDKQDRAHEGSDPLNYNVSNSICFLTRVRFDHTGADPGVMQCEVYTDDDGNWRLYVDEGGGASADADCSARCVTF